MSRCFPFPPPGYDKAAVLAEREFLEKIQNVEEKEKVKEKKVKKEKRKRKELENGIVSGEDVKKKEKKRHKHKHKDKKDKCNDETDKKNSARYEAMSIDKCEEIDNVKYNGFQKRDASKEMDDNAEGTDVSKDSVITRADSSDNAETRNNHSNDNHLKHERPDGNGIWICLPVLTDKEKRCKKLHQATSSGVVRKGDSKILKKVTDSSSSQGKHADNGKSISNSTFSSMEMKSQTNISVQKGGTDAFKTVKGSSRELGAKLKGSSQFPGCKSGSSKLQSKALSSDRISAVNKRSHAEVVPSHIRNNEKRGIKLPEDKHVTADHHVNQNLTQSLQANHLTDKKLQATNHCRTKSGTKSKFDVTNGQNVVERSQVSKFDKRSSQSEAVEKNKHPIPNAQKIGPNDESPDQNAAIEKNKHPIPNAQKMRQNDGRSDQNALCPFTLRITNTRMIEYKELESEDIKSLMKAVKNENSKGLFTDKDQKIDRVQKTAEDTSNNRSDQSLPSTSYDASSPTEPESLKGKSINGCRYGGIQNSSSASEKCSSDLSTQHSSKSSDIFNSLPVPKFQEWSDFDDQSWLFPTEKTLRKSDLNLNADAPVKVWDKSIPIPSVNLHALPFVVPF
eukprot:TRINITY_DN2273_c0_g1_i2.p1 TRINITY_DN2273_c0_g1~~TRINITY_DN2273_c0_g1_i2.p1  ORF type:complete len:620 (+),score=157.15 TRINITY_DN2273_c0_g1_i2:474-2333(+)